MVADSEESGSSQLKCGLETGLAVPCAALLEKTPLESGWSVGMAE
jgi:hypothetical protein